MLTLPTHNSVARKAGFLVFIAACISLAFGLTQALHFNPYPEYENSKKITQMTVCEGLIADCTNGNGAFRPVTLPVFLPPVQTGQTHAATFAFSFNKADIDSDVGAIFLPRYSDGLSVVLNGTQISPNSNKLTTYPTRPFIRLWHQPFYTNIFEQALSDTQNDILIELRAYNYSRIELAPVYIGDSFRLRIANQFRFMARSGHIRIAFAILIGQGFILMLLWAVRRKDREYGWAVISNISSTVICWHYVFPNIFPNISLSMTTWTLTWNIAVQVYIYALYKYSRALLKIAPSRLSEAVLAYTLISTLGLCLTPEGYLADALKFYHFGNGLIALIIPYLFLSNLRPNPVLNGAHGFVFTILYSFALRDYLHTYIAPDWAVYKLGQFIPLAISMVISSLLVTRLAGALTHSEVLQDTMRDTIEKKSAEIVHHEKQHAIDGERHRIMLDLHDGVGGQLVNSLAYMAEAEHSDPIVKSSIEAALRDMALIIDSLEGYQDLATLLGSHRERIEPLLHEGHVKLLWQLEDLPDMGAAHTSHNLNVVRIIQEAITNAVKHGKPKTITIKSDARSISVIDDGCGFDLNEARKKVGTHSGIGLNGMKHRAKDAGIDCQITTGPEGTQVKLLWDFLS